jgi:hypothetical protein
MQLEHNIYHCNFGFTFRIYKVTKSMQSALADLNLRHLRVVYPGAHRYPAHEKITMLPLADIATLPAEVARMAGSARLNQIVQIG